MKPLLFALLLGCAACVPAQMSAPTPAVFRPFVVADGRFRSAELNVRIPQGWRVVTGEAGAPRTVTLVAPDDCGVIVVSVAPLREVVRSPGCPDAPMRGLLRRTAGGFYLSASAPQASWEAFARALESVRESIAAGT